MQRGRNLGAWGGQHLASTWPMFDAPRLRIPGPWPLTLIHGQVVEPADTRRSERRAFGRGSSTLPLVTAEWTGVAPARSHKPQDAGSNPASATGRPSTQTKRDQGTGVRSHKGGGGSIPDP
jgi:hypothetical protein